MDPNFITYWFSYKKQNDHLNADQTWRHEIQGMEEPINSLLFSCSRLILDNQIS